MKIYSNFTVASAALLFQSTIDHVHCGKTTSRRMKKHSKKSHHDDDGIVLCDTSAAASWGDACAVPNDTEMIENATAWWYEYYEEIESFIPPKERQYYQEPFGGATQPSNYRSDLRKSVLSEESNEQGVRYSHLLGGRTVGSRAPLHRHDFGATTHVLGGYITLFLTGKAPQTFGPEESYYMPPGGNVMSAAVMPKPVYKGKQVEQPAEGYSKNIDTNASPAGKRVTVFVEREIISDGEYFYWLNGAYTRCDEAPRYACQNDGYTYEPN